MKRTYIPTGIKRKLRRSGALLFYLCLSSGYLLIFSIRVSLFYFYFNTEEKTHSTNQWSGDFQNTSHIKMYTETSKIFNIYGYLCKSRESSVHMTIILQSSSCRVLYCHVHSFSLAQILFFIL